MVEPQSSKLITRVRFPSSAPLFFIRKSNDFKGFKTLKNPAVDTSWTQNYFFLVNQEGFRDPSEGVFGVDFMSRTRQNPFLPCSKMLVSKCPKTIDFGTSGTGLGIAANPS